MKKEDDDSLFFEEEFHSKDRKIHRKERKRATAKDRSKYKKSDRDQLKKRQPRPPSHGEKLKRGRVLAITPEGIIVDHEHKLFSCALKGVLKKETSQLKNLVAVGDFVHFSKKNDAEGVISSIEERRSVLSRADNLSRRKEQLIAVNIDQVLIITSVVLPPLKPFLIDRYLIATKKGNMDPVIVVNKIDLLKAPPSLVDADTLEEEKALFKAFKQAYSKLGIPLYCVSATTGEGLGALKQAMQGKASVFSGQSGVGKSSLINALLGTELATRELVAKTSKGAHTTSTTHLIPLENEGFCIDTPGIRSFGIWELDPSELQSYFPDIAHLAVNCKYPDCRHLQEPGCAVKKAIEEGTLSTLRFDSYAALLTSLETEHRLR
jgi:ribosome biogenesis GTPase / thiamine phosphate phosphatase